MSKDEARAAARDQLEEYAVGGLVSVDGIQMSIAISLKRIADTLDRTFPIVDKSDWVDVIIQSYDAPPIDKGQAWLARVLAAIAMPGAPK